MKKRKIILVISLFVLFIIMVMVYLFYNKNDKKIDFDVERNNNVTNPTDYSKEINELKEKYNNDDVVGILSFDNTDYSAPIMQGEDNEYYLNHTPDKEDNYMGSIYLDYRVDIDNSKKLLIFGHNSSRVDMPFKILENYYDKNYYDDHKYIYVTTNNVKKKYEIFSVFVEYSDFTYMNINFANDSDYLEHLNKLKSKSMYDTNVDVSADDEILLLQTCSTHSDYAKYDKKYLLIIGKRV